MKKHTELSITDGELIALRDLAVNGNLISCKKKFDSKDLVECTKTSRNHKRTMASFPWNSSQTRKARPERIAYFLEALKSNGVDLDKELAAIRENTNTQEDDALTIETPSQVVPTLSNPEIDQWQKKCSLLECTNNELAKKVSNMESVHQELERVQAENKKLLEQIEVLQKANGTTVDIEKLTTEIEQKVRQELFASRDLRTKDGTKKKEPTQKILGFRIVRTIQRVPSSNGWKQYQVIYGMYDRNHRVYLGRGDVINESEFEQKIIDYCRKKGITLPTSIPQNHMAINTPIEKPTPSNPIPESSECH